MIFDSMGKSFLVRKIAKTIDETNEFLQNNSGCGVIKEWEGQILIAEIESLQSQYIQLGSKPSLDVWMSSLPGPARKDYCVEWIDGDTYGVKAPNLTPKPESNWIILESSCPEHSQFSERDFQEYKADWFFDFEDYEYADYEALLNQLDNLGIGELVDLGAIVESKKGYKIVKVVKHP